MKQVKFKIGTFGDRAVGKTTFLATLHGALSNHLYKGIEVRYYEDKTTKYLKDNFNDLINTKLVKSTSGVFDINFDLWYTINSQEYQFKVEMRDYEGEKTKVENMQIQEIVKFLATCDAIIYFYSITNKEKNPDEQNVFDLNTILTRIAQLENSRKTKKTFVLVLTKFDEMLSESELEKLSKYKTSEDLKKATNTLLEDWIAKNCSSLINELGRFVENFKVVVTSSFTTIDAIKDNVSAITPHKEGTTNIEIPGIDVSYPLTYILNQQVNEISKKDVINKIWKYFSIGLLLLGFFLF